MNLEKTTLWTVEIKTHDHTWKGIFAQKPTFHAVHRAILMEIDEIEQALKARTNDESDDEWLHTQKERTQYILELWECVKDNPANSTAWKRVKVAGLTIGKYRTTTSEVFTQEPDDA